MSAPWGAGPSGADARGDAFDDATRLSARRATPDEHGDAFDDATRLSARRATPDEDATRLASRRGGAPDAPDDGDEATRLASRRTSTPPEGGAVATGDDAAEADPTPSSSVDETTRTAGRGARTGRRPMLPPGAPATDVPRQGDFGAQHERYEARPTPVVTPTVQPATASAVPSAAANSVLTPDEVAAKRERARRKRLAGIAIAVAVGAGLITAVVVVALTMLRGAA